MQSRCSKNQEAIIQTASLLHKRGRGVTQVVAGEAVAAARGAGSMRGRSPACNAPRLPHAYSQPAHIRLLFMPPWYFLLPPGRSLFGKWGNDVWYTDAWFFRSFTTDSVCKLIFSICFFKLKTQIIFWA